MKKLILLLLFIPLVSFGQVTLDKILNIETEQDFKRTFIEAGFQKEIGAVVPSYADRLVRYTKKIVNQSIVASLVIDSVDVPSINFAGGLANLTVYISFTPDRFDRNAIYDGIYEKVKADCRFYEIRNSVGTDVAFYHCPNPNPNPRLVALPKTLLSYWDYISNRSQSNLFSDYRMLQAAIDLKFTEEIGFAKYDDKFLIQYPIANIVADELIIMGDDIIKRLKEMKKEESN